MKKWLDRCGEDDCPYMFVIKQKNDGSVHQVAEGVLLTVGVKVCLQKL